MIRKILLYALSACFLVGYFTQLLVSRSINLGIANDTSTSNELLIPLMGIGMICIGFSSLFIYMTTKQTQTLSRLLFVFVVASIAFSPLMILLYGIVAVLPIYSVTGQGF